MFYARAVLVDVMIRLSSSLLIHARRRVPDTIGDVNVAWANMHFLSTGVGDVDSNFRFQFHRD